MSMNNYIYLAINQDGTEVLCQVKMERGYSPDGKGFWTANGEEQYNDVIFLPTGTIKKLIGRKLSWNSEQVKYAGD